RWLHAARRLGRLAHGSLEVVVVNPTDYFLYLPLLPEVAAGILDPRTVAVPMAAVSRRVRHVLGAITDIDTGSRQLVVSDPEGNRRTVGYDHLVVALGSVNKLLPIPGVADHSHGFRSLAEALYLRDHLLRQIELADLSADRAERDARTTFVVVGPGYTGTEVAAQLQLLSRIAARRRPGLAGQRLRWMLLDLAPRIMPELDPRLSATATKVLSGRGIEIRTGTSVEQATVDGVKLSDGEFVPTRLLSWCVGVRPDPMVARLGLPMQRSRLTVDEYRRTAPPHTQRRGVAGQAAAGRKRRKLRRTRRLRKLAAASARSWRIRCCVAAGGYHAPTRWAAIWLVMAGCISSSMVRWPDETRMQLRRWPPHRENPLSRCPPGPYSPHSAPGRPGLG